MIYLTQEMIDDDFISIPFQAALDRHLKTFMGIPWMRERQRKGYYWSVLHEHVMPGWGYNITRFW